MISGLLAITDVDSDDLVTELVDQPQNRLVPERWIHLYASGWEGRDVFRYRVGEMTQ